MRPYLILMAFAIVALLCGQMEARTVVRRSRSVIKQQAVQRLHTPAKKVLSLPQQMLKARGTCANGQCRR